MFQTQSKLCVLIKDYEDKNFHWKNMYWCTIRSGICIKKIGLVFNFILTSLSQLFLPDSSVIKWWANIFYIMIIIIWLLCFCSITFWLLLLDLLYLKTFYFSAEHCLFNLYPFYILIVLIVCFCIFVPIFNNKDHIINIYDDMYWKILCNIISHITYSVLGSHCPT